MPLLSPIQYIMAKTPSKQRCSRYGPESVSSVGESSMDLEEFSFLWIVNNLSTLSGLSEIRSPIFRGGGPNQNYGWQLVIYVGRKLDVIDYYSFRLLLVDYGDFEGYPAPVRANYQVSILDAGGEPVKKSAEDKPTAEFTSLGDLSGVIVLTVLTSPPFTEIAEQLAENTIKIHCKLAIFSEMKHKVSPGGMTHYTPSAELKNASFRDSFARDFGKLFRDSIATDLTISTGKTTFQAHTLILKARSSVFAAMFNTKMFENETKTLTISDFDDVIVNGMLEYLYTGATDCMDERALELLQIAEKYDLAELKEDCRYAMAESLTKDNAAMFWVLANAVNVPFLIQRTEDFAYLNNVDLNQPTVFDVTVIKIKVPSARDHFADLLLSQLFIEAGHLMENGLAAFC